MARTDLDDVRLLEEEFAEAMTRLYAVGNGLAALRARLIRETEALPPVAVAAPEGRAATAPAPPVPAAGRTTGPAAEPAAGPVPAVPAPPVEPAAPERREPLLPWWQREGMVVRLLGVAGALVLLIGVALLLAFAIQHGYLGPGARVGAAAVLAAALVGAAVRLHRDPARRAGAVAIAAAGYATAYLDVVAVTTIYRWLPPATGLVIAGLIAASGVVLARAWDRQLLALITVGGVAALAPAVGDGRHLLTAGFLVVLAAATYPAHIGRTWLTLHAVRSLPAAAAVVVAADTEPGDGVLVLAGALAAVELGTAWLATRIPARTHLLTPVLLAAPFAVLVAVDGADVPAWVAAAVLAVAHLVVAVTAGRVAPAQPVLALAPWAGGLGAALAVFAVLDGAARPSVPAALLGLACVWAVASRVRDGGPAPAGGVHRPWVSWCALAVAALAVLDYLPLVRRLAHRGLAVDTVVVDDVLASLLLIALGLLLPGVLEAVVPPGPAARMPDVALAWPLVLVGASATVIGAAVLLGERAGAPAGGFVTGHGLATLLWAVAAAYLLMHGLRRSRDATLALRTGLVLAAVAVAKLLFFDLAALDGIVRIVAFIGAGLALLAMGAGYARALERTRVTPGVNRG